MSGSMPPRRIDWRSMTKRKPGGQLQALIERHVSTSQMLGFRLRIDNTVLVKNMMLSNVSGLVNRKWGNTDTFSNVLFRLADGVEKFQQRFEGLDLESLDPVINVPTFGKKMNRTAIISGWYEQLVLGCIGTIVENAEINDTPIYFSGKPILKESRPFGPTIIKLKLQSAENILRALILAEKSMDQFPQGIIINVEDFFPRD